MTNAQPWGVVIGQHVSGHWCRALPDALWRADGTCALARGRQLG
jgi:hypothetical protein